MVQIPHKLSMSWEYLTTHPTAGMTTENMAFRVISECQKLSPDDPCFFQSSPAPPHLEAEVL